MSAEILREAAALMRAVADEASAGPWSPFFVRERLASNDAGEWMVDSDATFICSTHIGEPRGRSDAEHIASWHPAVALAVADWLDSAASGYVEAEPLIDAALVVARAYLGRDA